VYFQRLLFATVLVALPEFLPGQQTIINVPSVDQTPRGRFFALHETQLRTWNPKPYWVSTNFLTYGLTDRIELAATIYNIGVPNKPYQAVALGWKTAQPVLRSQLPGWEITVGAGQMLPVSLTGKGDGLWNYAQVAWRLPVVRTRLMAGLSNGTRNLFGKRTTHMIASFEQPLAGHWNLLGEWWSGTHDFADFVPGLNYHWGTNVVIVGYKVSNIPGSIGDGLILEFGRTF
jgi:hypothetical protein